MYECKSEYETVQECAARLGLSPRTLYLRLLRGKIPGADQIRAGRNTIWRIPREYDPAPLPEGRPTVCDPDYISITQAAALLGVARSTLYYRISRGRLMLHTIEGKPCLLRADVDHPPSAVL